MIAFTLSLVVTAITALSPLPAEPYIPAPTPIEATSDFSSFRYTVEASASIRWSAQRVDLVERITLENVGELPIASVNLLSFPRGVDAWSNERLFVDGVEQVATHPTKISIGVLFPEPVASGASVTIELRGTISPARSRDRFGRLGWSSGTLNLGQWLALPDRPVRRSTVGDPVSPPPADSIEIRVTSDRTLGRDAVQASGLLLDGPALRGRSWRFRIENARGAALLANPELRVVRRIEPTSGVRIVGAARSRSDASSLSWDARLALGPFSRWFGTPPWELLRVVELPGLAIAQEYPGLITIGERVRSQRFVV